MRVVGLEEVTTAVDKYQFHRFVNVGDGVYKIAVGNTDDELDESVFRIKAEAHKFIAPETALSKSDTAMTFGVYADRWIDHDAGRRGNLRENTKSRYQSKVNVLKRQFGNEPLACITIQMLQDYFEGLSQNYCISYVRDLRNILKQIFELATADGYMQWTDANWKRVHIKGKPSEERIPLSRDDQRKLMEMLPKISRLEDRLFLAIAFYTGMRNEEIYGLPWANIDFNKHQIHVDQCAPLIHGQGVISKDLKTKAGIRTIPMDPHLEALLQPHKSIGLVLPRLRGEKTGEPYSEQMRKLQRKRLRKLMHDEGFIPYILRHTFVQRGYEGGISQKALEGLMGHADERPTMRIYSHITDTLLETAGQQMKNAIADILAGK